MPLTAVGVSSRSEAAFSFGRLSPTHWPWTAFARCRQAARRGAASRSAPGLWQRMDPMRMQIPSIGIAATIGRGSCCLRLRLPLRGLPVAEIGVDPRQQASGQRKPLCVLDGQSLRVACRSLRDRYRGSMSSDPQADHDRAVLEPICDSSSASSSRRRPTPPDTSSRSSTRPGRRGTGRPRHGIRLTVQLPRVVLDAGSMCAIDDRSVHRARRSPHRRPSGAVVRRRSSSRPSPPFSAGMNVGGTLRPGTRSGRPWLTARDVVAS